MHGAFFLSGDLMNYWAAINEEDFQQAQEWQTPAPNVEEAVMIAIAVMELGDRVRIIDENGCAVFFGTASIDEDGDLFVNGEMVE